MLTSSMRAAICCPPAPTTTASAWIPAPTTAKVGPGMDGAVTKASKCCSSLSTYPKTLSVPNPTGTSPKQPSRHHRG